jgi:hypothetical protein
MGEWYGKMHRTAATLALGLSERSQNSSRNRKWHPALDHLSILREHSPFFWRLLPGPVLDSLPVAFKDSVKGPMVFGTAQGQHLVGVGHSPTTPLNA